MYGGKESNPVQNNKSERIHFVITSFYRCRGRPLYYTGILTNASKNAEKNFQLTYHMSSQIMLHLRTIAPKLLNDTNDVTGLHSGDEG